MKAIGFTQSLPIENKESLFEFETEMPVATGRDLLVQVEASGMNPVDQKVRNHWAVDAPLESPRVLGFDASGIVTAVGERVTKCKVGDPVYYSGDFTRAGSNAQYQLVDERFVAIRPTSLSTTEAAAVPLVALTAWELLFERMHIHEGDGKDKTLLCIGAAGGVGSMAIQFAKQLTQFTVIATASRPETTEWCRSLGADVIVNHHDLQASLQAAGYETVDYIMCLNNTNEHWDTMLDVIVPLGTIGLIVREEAPLDMTMAQRKSIILAWELMGSRSIYKTADMAIQGDVLARIADMYDAGTLKGILKQVIKGFSVENQRNAHAQLETGATIGKLVLDYRG